MSKGLNKEKTIIKNKRLDNRIVEPVKFIGKSIRLTNYMTAQYKDNGKIVLNKVGKPILFKNIV